MERLYDTEERDEALQHRLAIGLGAIGTWTLHRMSRSNPFVQLYLPILLIHKKQLASNRIQAVAVTPSHQRIYGNVVGVTDEFGPPLFNTYRWIAIVGFL